MGGLLPDLAGPRGGGRADDRPARPGRPPHPHARLGRHARGSWRSSTTSRRTPTSTSSRSPTTSGSTPRWPPGRSPATAAARFEVVVGEEITTRGGHLLALFIEEPVRPLRSLRSTIAEIHDQGGLAIPAHPLVPYPLCAQGFVLRRLLGRVRSALPPGRARDVQPDGARPAGARAGRPVRRRARAGGGRQQRRPRGRGDRHGLDDVPGPQRRTTCARAILDRTTHAHGSFHGTGSQVSTFGRQLRKYGRDVRDEVRGRVRRDGTGRDHGYPGGRARPPRYEPEPASQEAAR